FGLLSQVSPDGKLAVSTVKDRSVFVPQPGLAFSQLFFPVKGILAIYSREEKAFRSLPGADDPRFVQSNPSWSPDGKFIIFARHEAYDLKHIDQRGRVLLSAEECREFLEEGKPFRFDLYRIPYNGGRGGVPEPIKGASHNGASNYFGRYSPDGKWIVFCRASNYMLLAPDSELYIIPAEGGKARRLRCNTRRMNSWHSWSPNGRWLVFSSKANGPYTQLYLTHIDEKGRSTPAVLLSQFTAPDRAANIPEFVNAAPGAIKRIHERFVDYVSHRRAGDELFKHGDVKAAIRKYEEALKLKPDVPLTRQKLGKAYLASGELEKAGVHLSEAARLDPRNPLRQADAGAVHLRLRNYRAASKLYSNALELKPGDFGFLVELGRARFGLGELAGAIRLWKRAERIQPGHPGLQLRLGDGLSRLGKHSDACQHYARAVRLDPNDVKASGSLGRVLLEAGRPQEAAAQLTKAVRLDPKAAELRYALGLAMARQGKPGPATRHWSNALRLQPDHVDAHVALGRLLAQLGSHERAIAHLSRALRARPRQPRTLLDLGASHAALGQFPQAVSACEKALALAREADETRLVGQIERRIERYRRASKE
ncbi:MAG: tetratricopeptide repeat protein, partial [Planctomycetota bacterium]